MGRGRAKAKQQKVARDLKYNTPATDLDSLQRELGSPNGHAPFDGSDGDIDGETGGDTDDLERWASGSR